MPAEKDQLYPFAEQALVFRYLQYKSFENTAGKGEIARNEQFILFPQCFIPIWKTFCYFHQIKNCRLQTLSLDESKICRLGKCICTFNFTTKSTKKTLSEYIYRAFQTVSTPYLTRKKS